MAHYLLRRLASMVLTLFAASIIIFLMIEIVPGDPAAFMLGLNAAPDTVAALRQELGPRGFEVLAVGVDESRDDALGFLAEAPVTYPVVWDPSGDTPRRYAILGMPTGYLIDREGVVRLVHQGFRRGDGERLRAEILHLLGD